MQSGDGEDDELPWVIGEMNEMKVQWFKEQNEQNCAQSAPVSPKSFFGLSVRHMDDLTDTRDDVRPSADKLAHLTYLIAFRQRKDVLDSSCCRDLLIEPDQQCLECQERLIAD